MAGKVRQDRFEIIKDVAVFISNHEVALRAELLGSLFVVRETTIVRFAVCLHNHLALRTAEVGDVFVDWDLAAELKTVEPSVAQAFPEDLLGGCLARSKLLREVEKARVDSEGATIHFCWS